MSNSSDKRNSKGPPPGTAFQIKITVHGSKPPIWRRIVVPADISLDRLHEVIQTAMGWGNCHLHLFEVDGEEFAGRGPDGFLDPDFDGPDEADYRLCDVAGEKDKFNYTYDFGDDWEHDIIVEKIIPPGSTLPIWVCLAGKGNCPPEDCGGIHGFYDALQAVKNPKHPEHKMMKKWMGDFDPDEFDTEEVDRALERFKDR
jgi:hypothetical protein